MKGFGFKGIEQDMITLVKVGTITYSPYGMDIKLKRAKCSKKCENN